jgi:hypothetical protein
MTPWYRSHAFWSSFFRGMFLVCLLCYPPYLAFLAYWWWTR